MPAARPVDVLLVSLGSTHGLRHADAELAESLQRLGATVVVARASPPRQLPSMMLTDLAWARAARAAALGALAELRGQPPRSVIYSSTTSALLWPRTGAIRFDATAAGNRPGRHGLWQRPLERRRLAQATMLLPWSEAALNEAPACARRGERVLVLPVPVEAPDAAPDAALAAPRGRDIAALTYAANPAKKGLDRVLAAWRALRAERGERGEELVVAGISAQSLQRAGLLAAGERGVRAAGWLSHGDYRALLARTRVFVCAPRREDYGIAQLEALAAGCQLVTTPAPGPYAALAIARALDPRLVGDSLVGALRCALEDPVRDYHARALAALAPFTRAGVERVLAGTLLPRLLAQPAQRR
jgi:glycosyltransferase involved in cell wall biosynthesis